MYVTIVKSPLICSRFSKVFISVYDKAKIRVVLRNGASVCVHKHGNKCEVVARGDVMQGKIK